MARANPLRFGAAALAVALLTLLSFAQLARASASSAPALQRTDLCESELTDGGSVRVDTTLPAGDYGALTCNLTVTDGATLTLQSGTTIAFEEGRRLSVNDGSGLIAQGSESDPVRLVSAKPEPAAGDWAGVSGSRNARIVRLDGFEILHTEQAGVRSLGAPVDLRNGRIAESAGSGVNLSSARSVVVVNMQIEENAESGLEIGTVSDQPATVRIEGSSFRANGEAAVTSGSNVFWTLSGNAAEDNGINGIRIASGTLRGDYRWPGGDLPFVPRGAITVQDGSLTLDPDLIVKFETTSGALRFRENAGLTAVGSEEQPIIVTSIADDEACNAPDVQCDTGNDGVTTPQDGAWQSVALATEALSSTLRFVDFRYGGTQAMLDIEAPNVSVSDSRFFAGSAQGIRVENVSVEIRDSLFERNAENGIEVEADVPIELRLSDNTFVFNENAVVIDGGDAEVFATGNQTPDDNNDTNGIRIGGDMTVSHTWRAGDLPFVVDGSIDIEERSATLTIEPGTVVKMDENAEIVVSRGELVLGAENGERVLITSLADDACSAEDDPGDGDCDTGGDGGDADPLAGDWRSIRIDAASKGATLQSGLLRYGGTSVQSEQLLVEHPDTLVQDMEISWGGGSGISVNEAAPTLVGNDIHHNRDAGIQISGGDTPLTVELNGNEIHDNGFGAEDRVGAIEIDTNVELRLDDENRLYREEGEQVNGIVIDGQATNNRRWQKSNLPYVILNSVDFVNSATLTIDPGVIVRFDEGARLQTSRGFLEAVGTEDEPIIFTSLADDDNPNPAERTDPSAGEPSAGNWIGLTVPEVVCAGGGEYCGRLENVEVRYAGRGGAASVAIEQRNTLLRNALIRDGAGAAIGIEDADDVEILDSRMLNMEGDGIEIEASSSIETTIQGNTIENTVNAIRAEATAQLVLGDGEETFNEVRGNRINGVLVFGTVERNRTWTADDLIWVLDERVAIDGGTLEVESGAVIKSLLGGSLALTRGSLLLGEEGAERPVLLTGIREDVCGVEDDGSVCDTNGDDDASVPLPGDWAGVSLRRGGDTAIFHNVVVRYGGANDAAIESEMASTELRDIVVEDSLEDGLLLEGVGTLTRPAVVENLLARNNRLGTGLSIVQESHARIVNAVFTGNLRSVEHRSSGTVDFIGNVAINNENDAMLYCADVETSQEWTADLTREIDCAVRVVGGSLLSIVPGSLLRFGGNRSLDVRENGLEAEGVVFTAAEGSEEPGAWGGVSFEDRSRGFLRYNLFAYGGSSSSGVIDVQSSGVSRDEPVRVEYNTLLRSDSTAISVQDDIYTEIRGNLIRGIVGNRSTGIRLRGEDATLVQGNRIDDVNDGIAINDKIAKVFLNNLAGVRGFGVSNDTTANCIDAAWNWWGHTSGPVDDNDRSDRCESLGQGPTNPDGEGVEVSNNVLYTPWLRSRPPLMPVVDTPRAGVTNQGEQTVIGHGNAGDDIRVYDRVGDAEAETVIATGQVGADGTFRIPVSLAPGAHHLSVESFAAYGGAAEDAPDELTSPRTGYRQVIVEPSTEIDPASIVFRYAAMSSQPPSEIVQPLRAESGAAVACAAISGGRVVLPEGESVVVEAAAEGASGLEFVQDGEPVRSLSAAGGVFRSEPFVPAAAPFQLRVAGAEAGCGGYVFFGGGGRVFEDSGVPGPALFEEGFEGPDSEWTDPERWFVQDPWGRNAEEKNSGQYSMDSNPGGTYGKGREVALQLKEPLNLQQLVAPELTFHHWYRIAGGDEARVEYKLSQTDSWKELRGFSGIQNVWSSETISLEEIGSQPRVYLRWVLDANSDDNVAEGWRVDDIVVRSGGKLNGRYDEGEPLVGGVTVRLLQRNPDNGRFALWDGGPTGQFNPQVTNDAGRYGFFSLPPGEYRIEVTPPSGQSATVPDTIVIDGTMEVDVPLSAATGIYLPVTMNNGRF